MRKTLVLLVVAVMGSVAQAQRVAPPDTLIRNATVITVTRGTLENTDVLLRNGKIAAVGKNLNAPSNARIIDGTGKYVMPGIIAPCLSRRWCGPKMCSTRPTSICIASSRAVSPR
jgi:predicted amidohydrolase